MKRDLNVWEVSEPYKVTKPLRQKMKRPIPTFLPEKEEIFLNMKRGLNVWEVSEPYKLTKPLRRNIKMP